MAMLVSLPARIRMEKASLVAVLLTVQMCLLCIAPELKAQSPVPLARSNGGRFILGAQTAVTDKVALANAIALATQEDLCVTPVTLKVTDANLEEILAQLRLRLPLLSTVEVRLDNPARFSLDLPHASVGKILQATAALMGGNLYVSSDHLLIAAPKQLGEDERAEFKAWAANIAAGGAGWSAKMVAKQKIIEYLAAVMGKPGGWPRLPPFPGTGLEELPVVPLKTLQARYGDLPADAQSLLQQLSKWPTPATPANGLKATPLALQSNTVIELSYDDFYSRLEIKTPAQPNPYVWDNGISPEYRQQILKYRAEHAAH